MEINDDGRSVARYAGVDLREVGDWEAGEVIGEAIAPLHDHLRGPGGGVRTGALLTMCDNVGGFCAGLAALPDGWVVSTNLTLTVAPLQARGPLLLRSTVLRAGRAAIVTDVRVTDGGADGAIVADAVLTSAVLIPEGGPPVWTRPAHLHAPPPEGPLPPLLEWLGVRDVAGAPAGVVELDITDAVRNPWGIMHGGVTASLVDVAAERAAAAYLEVPVDLVATGDVALHFLAPSRVGPVRATATVMGDRRDGTVVLVEVRDTGRDRVAARGVTTVRPR
jgi:1,4-dihydroxy-2-naphthoyl-CoA hydrolase